MVQSRSTGVNFAIPSAPLQEEKKKAAGYVAVFGR